MIPRCLVKAVMTLEENLLPILELYESRSGKKVAPSTDKRKTMGFLTELISRSPANKDITRCVFESIFV
jgi:hypothetical protein